MSSLGPLEAKIIPNEGLWAIPHMVVIFCGGGGGLVVGGGESVVGDGRFWGDLGAFFALVMYFR